jgi:pyridoxamine 5'-phosphate oxidase
MARDPFDQLKAWVTGAIKAKIPDPNAMTLATVDRQGQPAARIVLLRDIRSTGLTFYTHHRSRKGRELAGNPRAAATLFWASLERQVRIEGCVEKLSDAASDAYFEKRLYETRLGAWASPQSETIAGRHVLDKAMEQLRKRYPDGKVPRPPHWGGYQLVPHCFEFWQGRPHRLNDRLLYTYQDAGTWSLSRLAP